MSAADNLAADFISKKWNRKTWYLCRDQVAMNGVEMACLEERPDISKRPQRVPR